MNGAASTDAWIDIPYRKNSRTIGRLVIDAVNGLRRKLEEVTSEELFSFLREAADEKRLGLKVSGNKIFHGSYEVKKRCC